jgi:hypothetical protein
MDKFMFLVLAVIGMIGATEPSVVSLEHLGQPVRARNIIEGLLTVRPQDGKEILILSNNNEFTGAELIFIDLESRAATIVKAPAGAGIDSVTEVPDHRLALGTFYDGTVMLFDMKTMQFVKSVRFGTETYLWGFAMGSDSRAYFGSFPGGKLGALDLNTYSVEDLGAPAPRNFYLRTVLSTPDGRILCRFMVEKPTWLLFDPMTRRFDPVLEELRGARIAARWDKYIVSGQRAFEGPDLHLAIPSPFPVPQNATAEDFGMRVSPTRHPKQIKWEVSTLLTNRDTLYISQGKSLWKFRKGDKKLSVVISNDLRGARIFGETRNGRIIGVRGQDYFMMRPGDARFEPLPIPGKPSPRTIFFLHADAAGRIWGGPPYGQTLFWMDPATKKVVNTATISDSGGEVYEVAFLDGVTYAAAYAGGEIIQYDPEKPWDQWGQSNPKTIAHIGPEFVRPTGGIIVGPGQKLYSGWTAGSGYGGAIAITDPQSSDTKLLRNPFGSQQIMGVATDGDLLYAGTGLGGSGLPDQVGQSAKFGIIDPSANSVIAQYTVDGANRIRVIGYDARTHIVATIVDTYIRLFDTTARSFLTRGAGAPRVASWSNAMPGDGKLYFGSGKQVLALDLASGGLNTIADVDGYVNNVTVGPNSTIYFGIGADLYAIPPTAR